MNDEESFQAALDKNPDDATTRLVFADWLEERGDVRAAGYRALGLLRRTPLVFQSTDGTSHWWVVRTEFLGNEPRCCLPVKWFRFLEIRDNGRVPLGGNYRNITRQEIEDATAIAFSKLDEDYRQQLLQFDLTKIPT